MLPIACCLLPIAIDPFLGIASWCLTNLAKMTSVITDVRHGHEMLWLPRCFSSESEFQPSYNAKL